MTVQSKAADVIFRIHQNSPVLLTWDLYRCPLWLPLFRKKLLSEQLFLIKKKKGFALDKKTQMYLHIAYNNLPVNNHTFIQKCYCMQNSWHTTEDAAISCQHAHKWAPQEQNHDAWKKERNEMGTAICCKLGRANIWTIDYSTFTKEWSNSQARCEKTPPITHQICPNNQGVACYSM
jgi:hypothetical protein